MSTPHVTHGVVIAHETDPLNVTIDPRNPKWVLSSYIQVTARLSDGTTYRWLTETPPALGAVVTLTVEVRS
jgi:hypothetical protein